jgi:hypothetical protein
MEAMGSSDIPLVAMLFIIIGAYYTINVYLYG